MRIDPIQNLAILLLVGLCSSTCVSKNKNDISCKSQENAHFQNVSKTIRFIDSVTHKGSKKIKSRLINTYEFVGEVHYNDQGKQIDTISTSLIEVMPLSIIIHPFYEGFLIEYGYKYSDTSRYLWNIPFINIGPPYRKTDFLYAPLQLFMPDKCSFRIVENSSPEHTKRNLNGVFQSKNNPNTTYSIEPKKIDITMIPCLSTSDILSIYLQLETCFLYGPVPD
jgi:hypothetical protein